MNESIDIQYRARSFNREIKELQKKENYQTMLCQDGTALQK